MGIHSIHIQLEGHLLDSLTLAKVLDEILQQGFDYSLEEIHLGKKRKDASQVCLELRGKSKEKLEIFASTLKKYGAMPYSEKPSEASTAPAPKDGVFPAEFYATSNHKTEVFHQGNWLDVSPLGMDSGVRIQNGKASAVKFFEVQKGDLIVIGKKGVRRSSQKLSQNLSQFLSLQGKSGKEEFAFMDSKVSSEKPTGLLIGQIASAMKQLKQRNADRNNLKQGKQIKGKILFVLGPAVVHTGAGEDLVQLIQSGWVDMLYGGNAIATHDIEAALFGTSLGVSLKTGMPIEHGHRNHLDAINRIRGLGSIQEAVQAGILQSGIMHACITENVDFLLAGSIRDDGPLPEVITDVIAAQRLMKAQIQEVQIAIMIGTMLHSIAVGNLLPEWVQTFAVDINPSVVTKLADRGSHQAEGLVMGAKAFLSELRKALEEGEDESPTL